MAFDTKGFTQAAQQAGYSQDEINRVVKQKTGTGSWFTNGEKGFKGILNAGANILNLPSYAVGGILNRGQELFGSQYGQGDPGGGLGLFEGIKNKRAVMSELPETIGVDPDSTMGKVIGFGGELLTPNIPFGKAFKAFKRVDAVADAAKGVDAVNDVSKVRKIAGKVVGVKDDAARVLLEKSYKLSASDINKIADSIGVTNEAEKAIKVVDYLQSQGLQGSTRKSLRTLNKVIKEAQRSFDDLAKTGGQVSRQPFIDNLFEEATKAEKLDTPQSRNLMKKLLDEAEYQSGKINEPLTDTDLSKRISSLFSEAGDSAIADPMSAKLSKRMAIAGQDARETLRPGTKVAGRKLRGLRTAQDVIGKKANTGLGTQLFNAVKPNAIGAGLGAGYGAATGQSPLKYGAIGFVANTAANNPAVMNFFGRNLQKGLPEINNEMVKKSMNFGGNVLKKTPGTALRVSAQPTTPTSSARPQLPSIQQSQSNQRGSYKTNISPYNQNFKQTQPTAEDFYAEIRRKRGY